MELLKKKRTVLRTAFTRGHTKLLEGIQQKEDETTLKCELEQLKEKTEELKKLDSQIFESLLNEGMDEETLLKEIENSDDYSVRFKTLFHKLNSNLSVTTDSSASVVNNTSSNPEKRKFKLPKIELKKFDGELVNWLPFWSQFSKIHSDPDIDSEDKFQYLIQSIVPGSRAFDVVQSFPQTGANYSKAIDCLQTRFGKDDLLVEVYVRELLKIVLQNALGGKNTISLQSLYDKLESHMRALETLGVTTDKCSSMLYPLVESCMPEDLLRAWQRSSLRVGKDPQERQQFND